MNIENIDLKTVEGFGREWESFDQEGMTPDEHREVYDRYFSVFPFEDLPPQAEGFDLGCGSGRWALLTAPRVGVLHCIDPSDRALAVARRRLAAQPHVRFHQASSQEIPLDRSSQDFGYSLGVLHHIPNTERALKDCVEKLKPGAPFLIYLYYKFDGRPLWFKIIWRTSDFVRRIISRLPFPIRKLITSLIAATIYWPLARFSGLLERFGVDVTLIPLSFYRGTSFYTMRTDALDRFGTRLEQRFTREEIRRMMHAAGLENIVFYDGEPYWIACGRRSRDA